METKEVGKGLFSVEETMPCMPKDIGIGYYFLPNTFGRAEREEAAARIISFSHQLDQWVGVSWTNIVKQMEEDYKKDLAAKEKLDLHNERTDEWFRQLYRHFWLCVFTFGIYALFVQKPERPRATQEDQDTPFSGIYLFGPCHVAVGIQELVEQRMLMLKKVAGSVGEDTVDVFFPTPALVSRIMEVQGVTG
jgi:hypothetical protein